MSIFTNSPRVQVHFDGAPDTRARLQAVCKRKANQPVQTPFSLLPWQVRNYLRYLALCYAGWPPWMKYGCEVIGVGLGAALLLIGVLGGF